MNEQEHEDRTQTKIPEGGIMVPEQQEAPWLVTIGYIIIIITGYTAT